MMDLYLIREWYQLGFSNIYVRNCERLPMITLPALQTISQNQEHMIIAKVITETDIIKHVAKLRGVGEESLSIVNTVLICEISLSLKCVPYQIH